MKIAMVTDSFHPTVGGSETAIKKLSETMIDGGHEVIIYGVFDEVQNPIPEKLKVIKVSSKIFGINFKLFGLIYNLNKEIKKFKPDVVNAHFLLKSGFLGVLVAKINGISNVVTVRGKGIFYQANSLKQKILFGLYRKLSLKADRMIATSEEMADIAKKRWGRKPLPLSNGVDTKHFMPDINTDIKKQYNIEDKKLILCVRRLVPKNGIEYIVRAMPLILKEFPNAILMLVAPKKSEYDNLINISEDLRIADKLIFAGEVDHAILPEYLAAADIVVQPSLAEARSLACLEAMASGCAIIATNTGGLAELISHGENGYLVPAFEDSTYQVSQATEEGVNNLAAAVIELFKNEDLTEKIKIGARKKAEENSWEQIIAQTIDVYKEAMTAKK